MELDEFLSDKWPECKWKQIIFLIKKMSICFDIRLSCCRRWQRAQERNENSQHTLRHIWLYSWLWGLRWNYTFSFRNAQDNKNTFSSENFCSDWLFWTASPLVVGACWRIRQVLVLGFCFFAIVWLGSRALGTLCATMTLCALCLLVDAIRRALLMKRHGEM